MTMHNPAHPGEVLKDALEGIPTTPKAFALELGIDEPMLVRILEGRESVSVEMSAKISALLGQDTPEFWHRMQLAQDRWQAAHP